MSHIFIGHIDYGHLYLGIISWDIITFGHLDNCTFVILDNIESILMI